MASNTVRILIPGERSNTEGYAVKNKMLLAIPPVEFRAIRPHLQFLKMPHHQVLQKSNARVEFAYFLNRGMISLVVKSANGKTVEVAVVGSEGASGIPGVVNLEKNPLEEVIQIEGEGFRIEVGALRKLLKSAPQLGEMMSRFAIVQTLQIAQTAACNRLHNIQERLARWLLMTQDRVSSGWLPITHDFLATMLGTDRPSVTLAAGLLQKRGAIEYLRAAVRVVNRRRLERSACECYATMRQFNGDLGIE